MATNPFFQSVPAASSEQQLLESLVIESIKMYGTNTYYLPRTQNNPDKLYGADDVSSFDAAYLVEMYVGSIGGYSGAGHLYGKFGQLEQHDQMIMTVSKRVFEDFIGNPYGFARPQDGDVLYIPMIGKLFKILYVELYSPFFQLGTNTYYTLTLELYPYAQERFNTGVPEIDALFMLYNYDLLAWGIHDENGNAILDETGAVFVREDFNIETQLPQADNDEVQDIADEFLDFSEIDPLSGGRS